MVERFVIISCLIATLLCAGFERWVRLAPIPDLSPEISATALDREDRLLRAWQVGDGIWRLPATHDRVDQGYLAQLIAYEDGHFYRHGGVDPVALVRSAAQAVWYRRLVSGASTITMQVARLLQGRTTRSFAGKLSQIRLALALERRFSKQHILDLYLTLAPFGGNLEGIRAASLTWLGKEPHRLTPAEAALLVALPQSPEARRPDRFPERLRAARNRVLDRIAKKGVISRESADAARSERIPNRRIPFPQFALHETDRIRIEAQSVALTLDRDLQAPLERLISDHAATLPPFASAAMIVADHRTGEVLASIGSPGIQETMRGGFVDMTRAVRSPGSALKPLIYGMAFEAGIAHPESIIDDRPSSFGQYRPTNFDGQYRGPVSVRTALQLSLNIPAVTLLDAVGPIALMARMRQSGAHPVLPPHSRPGLAIGLGGVGLSLRDLVSVFAGIANQGSAHPLTLRPGETRSPRQILSHQAAWHVADVLAGTPAPLDASNGRIAFKTGTSYGNRDAWAVGFDGQYVVGVWTGRPDAAPVPGMTGISAAAPLLFRAFSVIDPTPTPLAEAPEDALTVPASELPPPLRTVASGGVLRPIDQPEIVFPPDNAKVQVRPSAPLALKLRGGKPPFTWFVNGRPVATREIERELSWSPDGPGHVTISVVDRYGRSDRSSALMQ
ncbi:MAG: penicillin-binding protein 1C [Pseudomonadota bacterium]